jgi:hypothetical protein
MRLAFAVCMAILLVTGCSNEAANSSESNHGDLARVSFTANDAIAKVLPQHPDFPATVSKQNIVRRGVGAPGSVLNGTIQTECQIVGPHTYNQIKSGSCNPPTSEDHSDVTHIMK